VCDAENSVVKKSPVRSANLWRADDNDMDDVAGDDEVDWMDAADPYRCEKKKAVHACVCGRGVDCVDGRVSTLPVCSYGLKNGRISLNVLEVKLQNLLHHTPQTH
jgi:hypothetical protein